MGYLKTHAVYVVIIAIGLLAFRSWLLEHDSRLAAEQTTKVAEAKVTDLQQQIVAVNAAAQKQVQVVVKQIEAVKSPAQAIAAIPTLTDAPLNSRPAVDSPTAVTVEAVPLAQELASCKITKIQSEACSENLTIETEIVAQKNIEILALSKKKGFWKTLVTTVKTVGVGIGVGVAIAVLVK